MIEVGQTIPQSTLTVHQQGETNQRSSDQLFKGKTVVLFAVPGAFTPTCSNTHLPGYVAMADKIKAKGVDDIICLAVNDAFVMEAWSKQQNAEHLTMAADGDASFSKTLGLSMDTGNFGGVRSQRYSMLIEDGKVKKLFVEPAKEFGVSSAEHMLEQLG